MRKNQHQERDRVKDKRSIEGMIFLVLFFLKANQTEREECVAYNIGTSGYSFLCLADDYCNQKYPFICEMNAASMKLANSVLHGILSRKSSLRLIIDVLSRFRWR